MENSYLMIIFILLTLTQKFDPFLLQVLVDLFIINFNLIPPRVSKKRVLTDV